MATASLLAAGACGGGSNTSGRGGTLGGGGDGGSGRGGGGDAGHGGGGPGGAAGGGGAGGSVGASGAGGAAGSTGASGGSGGGQPSGLEGVVRDAGIIGFTAPRSDFGAVIVANDGERIYAVESRRDVEPGPLGLPWRSRFRLAAYDNAGRGDLDVRGAARRRRLRRRGPPVGGRDRSRSCTSRSSAWRTTWSGSIATARVLATTTLSEPQTMPATRLRPVGSAPDVPHEVGLPPMRPSAAGCDCCRTATA